MTGAPPDRLTLRLRGRSFQRLARLAHDRVGRSPADTDAAEVLGTARVKRRGGGAAVYVRLTRQQAATIAAWLAPYTGREATQLRQLLERFAPGQTP